MYDPNYKLKYRPTPASHFRKYSAPLPMTGNPPGPFRNWGAYSRAVYERMMEIKLGIVPRERRKGLWFHATVSKQTRGVTP